jgi:hypothetical protein
MKLAWIENGKIRDVCHSNPNECYHPDIAALYSVQVPDKSDNGDGWDGVTLTKPLPPAPAPAVAVIPPSVSVITFKMLFTCAERIAIRAAIATDPVVSDWWSLLQDPRLTTVDMSLASVQSALDYLTLIGKLAVGRKAQILTGIAI